MLDLEEKVKCLIFRTFRWPSLSSNRFSGFMSLLQHFFYICFALSLSFSATCRWWRGSEDTQGRTQSRLRRKRRSGTRTSPSWAKSWRITIQVAKRTKLFFFRRQNAFSWGWWWACFVVNLRKICHLRVIQSPGWHLFEQNIQKLVTIYLASLQKEKLWYNQQKILIVCFESSCIRDLSVVLPFCSLYCLLLWWS